MLILLEKRKRFQLVGDPGAKAFADHTMPGWAELLLEGVLHEAGNVLQHKQWWNQLIWITLS